ncbi:phage/plasmid primase, P4 family [Alphaproteobacteria bacterium]|nr:phage/plasmid primase, P4 family [Alphaproteobacteria bacterium]
MVKSAKETALNIVTGLGLSVFPCNPGYIDPNKTKKPLVSGGFKAATTDIEIVSTWWDKFPDAAIGVPTGHVSGIVAIDIDVREDKNGENSLAQTGYVFDSSWQVKTPTGGRHIFFKHPGVPISNKAGNFLGAGIDFRGDGGYVIFCGSTTVAGSYESLPGCDPFSSQILDLPPGMIEKLSKKNILGAGLEKDILVGERNDSIFKLASKLASSGVYGEELLNMLIEYNNSHCSPPLDKEEIDTIYQSASKRNQQQILPLTDLGNSERFIKTANGEIFYCPENGSWLGSIDGTFQPSETIPYENAKATIREISNEITSTSNPHSLLKWSKTSQSVARIDAMIKLAQKDRRISRSLLKMDVDDHIINLKNGAYDLNQRQLLEDRASRFITKQARVYFKDGATCDRWLEFLSEVTDDDPDMVKQLQKAVGYTISGHTSAQLFFVCTGSGANGKSVFLETIDYLMGSYSGKLTANTLTGASFNKIPNELAGLTGKRFVTVSEMPSDEIVNTTTLKELTGQDTLSARFLYKEYFQLKPRFKIWIATNHNLRFTETSYALERRMVNFNFPVFFASNERDPELLNKLKKEISGVLNWAIEGYDLFKQEGIQASIHEQIIAPLRQDSDDSFQKFFQEQLIETSANDWLPLNEIIDNYASYLGIKFASSGTRRSVKLHLQNRGYLPERVRQGASRIVAIRGLQPRKHYDCPF